MNQPQRSSSSNPGRLPALFPEVDIRPALALRPARMPDYERENRAFSVLAAEIAQNPRNMLQKLVEVAVDLCGAHTAGISLLDGDVFRWEGVAGVLAAARGGTVPRDQSPCGVCVDTGTTQLMHLADRCFPALHSEPRFIEALIVPFFDHGVPIGTVWVVSHTDDRKFDAEDERILRVLAAFASAARQQSNTLDELAESHLVNDGDLATLAHELLDKSAVDLGRVVAEAIDTRRNEIEQRSQRLIVDLTSRLMLVEGDAVRLAQVTSSLLDHASRLTPAGGEILITLTAVGDEAHLEVRDSGVGIETRHLDAIFDPFRPLNVLRGGTGRGSGLGLALVKNIVTLHGGQVVASNRGADQGIQVSVRLPLSRPDDRAVANGVAQNSWANMSGPIRH
ncbi:MAG: GAF domain-containing sensor histidine kinase [Vicinamibacterales bacterium]